MLETSGIGSLYQEAKAFLSGVRFSSSIWLLLFVLPAVLTLLEFLATRWVSTRFQLLGQATTLRNLLTHPLRASWLAVLLLQLGWAGIVLGLAGPRWGLGEPDGVLVGRDLVIVLDVSRSMLAADTASGNRLETALVALKNLVDTLRQRGGHRVGVIVFAARPVVWVPLTADYDHVLQKLDELDVAHPPLDTRPTDRSLSGTQIGEALRLAVLQQDEAYPGSQDVLLLSDGDDPTGDVEDQLRGIAAAHRAKMPVHVVGIGDPDPERAVTIIVDGLLLESPDKQGIPQPVRTHLHEVPLSKIAAETAGVYIPSQREVPQLGAFFRRTIETKPSREMIDDGLPQLQNRASWFFLVGLVCWLLAWWRIS